MLKKKCTSLDLIARKCDTMNTSRHVKAYGDSQNQKKDTLRKITKRIWAICINGTVFHRGTLSSRRQSGRNWKIVLLLLTEMTRHLWKKLIRGVEIKCRSNSREIYTPMSESDKQMVFQKTTAEEKDRSTLLTKQKMNFRWYGMESTKTRHGYWSIQSLWIFFTTTSYEIQLTNACCSGTNYWKALV